ncbi:hypothetical protein QFC22_003954 [Naganishia vaughanmartiniae]|uniref:Uncharacterized protein n=1 Tax=Naganishia vaughanmartiniae TaxID=1424756 RepID=A0ACC2X400_9TREE|nr:hypothetical protein QFC22_003954 [Naganishia vaughanmartiniae]
MNPDDNSGSRGANQAELSLIMLFFLGFDLRPFLYPTQFPFQYKKIDALAAKLQEQYERAAPTEKAKVD